jgi:hypothetical protein
VLRRRECRRGGWWLSLSMSAGWVGVSGRRTCRWLLLGTFMPSNQARREWDVVQACVDAVLTGQTELLGHPLCDERQLPRPRRGTYHANGHTMTVTDLLHDLHPSFLEANLHSSY